MNFLKRLVWIFISILFIIAWPISKVLDLLLGEDHGTYYKRTELRELLKLHSQTSHIERGLSSGIDENLLTDEEILIIKGALDMQSKTAKKIMVPLEKVFMISSNTVFQEKEREKIYKEGYSRVPGTFFLISPFEKILIFVQYF